MCWYDDDPDFKILDRGLFEGVKIHELETPWVKERPKDLDRILSVLEERDVPVQFHAGEDAGCIPHELLPFAKRHPNLRIDFAHCRPYKEMIECLKECPNLFTDTAFMLPEHYPELVAAGVERQVLFGTDLPIQAGFYNWADTEVAKTLEYFYRKELADIRAVGYSEVVMSGNFKRYLSRRIYCSCPADADVSWSKDHDSDLEKLEAKHMKVSAVYVDGNGNEFPIKVCGYKCSNACELKIELDLMGLTLDGPIKVRIVNNTAVLDKGDPIADADDITYAHFDEHGNVVLSGYGG